jgi:hypothetical protein
MFSG